MSQDISTERAKLFVLLDEHDIAHETKEHRAVFTVEEGRDLKASMPGGHSKNLFVKDKKGSFFLAIAHADTRVDLVALGKAIGAKGRLSFGKPEAMETILGVSPGSVTPFAVINDTEHQLKMVIIDKALMGYEGVWFHPLENTASTCVRPEGLMSFMRACGVEPFLSHLDTPIREEFGLANDSI